jgi:hypothetical protein
VLARNRSGGLTLWPDPARDRFKLMADLLLHALVMAFAMGWEILGWALRCLQSCCGRSSNLLRGATLDPGTTDGDDQAAPC